MPLSPSALEPLLRLAVVPGVGPARLHGLIRHFGSADRVLAASAREIRSIPGFGEEMAGRVFLAREPAGAERGRRALALLHRHRAVALTPDDLEYPDGFRHLADPPFLVYAAGDLSLLRSPAVALVGTRRPSAYGSETSAALSRGLVEAGYVVVSGMASGIDAAAHRAAIDAGGGTIGVLGHGIERIYPAENRGLFRDVSERGLLVTEYPPGEEPKAGNFPRRNRLIAALCHGVVVVEMGLRSGARHTVDSSLELGREVFAVPGPIGSDASAGTNQLIKQGASLVTGVGDILESLRGLGWDRQPQRPPARGPTPGSRPAQPPGPDAAVDPPTSLPPDAARLVAHLDATSRHIDELAALAGLSPGEAAGALLHLELGGVVEALPGKLFRRR